MAKQMSGSSTGGELTKKFQETWDRQASNGSQMSMSLDDPDLQRQVSQLSVAFRERARMKMDAAAAPVVAETLTGYQASALSHMMVSQAKDHDDHGDDDHHGGHGHHEQPVSIFSALISSFVNFMLMFGLNCAYGMIMFSEPWMQQHQGLGVKMCLATSLIAGFGYSVLSGVPVAIAGTDVNPVVLVSAIIITISEEIGKEYGLVVPSASRRLEALCGSTFTDFEGLQLGTSTRRLSGSCGGASDGFCTGDHYAANAAACDIFHEELRATSIFAVASASLFMCIIFFTLGRLRLTQYVTYIPSAVMDAFLAAIGYKVFKFGIEFCLDDPRQFVPAAICGVALYFAKAYHIGPPHITIPAMLLIPLGVFYLVMYFQFDLLGSHEGSFIDTARNECLFFPEIEDVDFWRIWADSIGKFDRINFKAWAAGGVDIVVMLIVVLLDCYLKLAGTESKMGLKVDKDYESQMVGGLNLLTAACGAAPGYMQLKFNIINAGVLGNMKDRRAGIGYAIWCGICFFTTIKLFNFMPRFFMGVLLFFAGASFVAENLWGSRKFLQLHEWLQIMLIVAIFIVTNQLLYSVLAGLVIAGIDFLRRYAKVPIRKGPPLRGGRTTSKERFIPRVNAIVEHMANSWMLVIKLKGFIFFASAQSLLKHIQEHFDQQEEVPEFRRIKFLIFDCENLDDMDPSAIKTLHALVTMARGRNVRLLWSALDSSLQQAMSLRGSLEGENKDQFLYLEEAVGYVQHRIIDRAVAVQHNWCKVHPTFHLLHALTCKKVSFEPFHNILDADNARSGCPWKYCGRMRVSKYKTVLFTPDQAHHQLYLIHSGAIGLFSSMPQPGEEWGPPDVILRHNSFLNTELLMNAPTRRYAVALEDGDLIFWNRSHWARMSIERPSITNALVKTILTQEGGKSRILESKLVDAFARGEEDDDIFKSLKEEGEIERTAIISQEVQERVASLLAAHKLDAYRFYDSEGLTSEDCFLPELPRTIRRDLEVAFNSFCELSMASKGQRVLRPERCVDALMYAGIFNVLFIQPPEQELHLDDFVALGHEAFMMRLANRHMEAVEYVFKQFDPDNSGFLKFPELAALMRRVFHPHITTEFITNSLVLWGGAEAQQVNKQQFIGFMSRFLRIHEMDWYLLRAFEETIGLPQPKEEAGPPLLSLEVMHALDQEKEAARAHGSSAEEDFTTVGGMLGQKRDSTSARPSRHEHQAPEGANPIDISMDSQKYTFRTERLKALNLGLSEEEIEEMFWVADCYGGFVDNGELDHRLVAPILLTVFESPDGLPPLPRVPRSFETDKIGSSSSSKLDGVRKHVLDLRKLRHATLQQTEAIEHSTLDPHYSDAAIREKSTQVVKPAMVAMRGSSMYIAEEDEYLKYKSDQVPTKVEGTLLANLRALMEEPESSRAARTLWLARALVILLAVVTMVAEPMITENEHQDRTTTEKGVWLILEILFTVWFTVEFCLRVLAWTGDGVSTFKDFVVYPLNWADFLALLPLYVELALYSAGDSSSLLKIFRILRFCELARVARLCRLSKLHQAFPPIAVSIAVVWFIYLKGQV